MSASEVGLTCMELEESSVSTAAEERLPPARSRPTFPLRLPRSMRAEAVELACLEGISLNQLIVQAVAEKIARLELFQSSRKYRSKLECELEQVKAV